MSNASALPGAALGHATTSATQERVPQSGIMSLLRDRVFLPDSIENLKQQYQNARPFPYLMLDNVFSPGMLEAVTRDIPALDRETYVVHNDDHQQKFGLRSAVFLKENAFQFSAFLHSAAFLYLISEITGIWGLVPDPYMQGGGFHVIPRGGKFDVHVDRKTDYVTGLRRRLAFIVYLNKDWRPEYNGQLELWNADATKCEASILPMFNRIAMFEVAENNYHGHPNPIACPEGMTRNSFMVYYHTVPTDGNTRIDIRSSQFAPSFYRNKPDMLKQVLRDLTPPLIMRSVRSLRAKSR